MDVHTDPKAPILQGSVLVAQSAAFLQAYFGRSLSRLGVAHVRVAADGSRALELLSEGDFNLLLLDLDLPEVSGLDMLEILRADSAYDNLSIVVTTNSCNADTVKRVLELGVSDFLAKPYTQDTVDQRLLDALRRSLAGPKEGLRLLVAHRDRLFVDAVTRGFGSAAQVTPAHNLGVFLTRGPHCEADAVIFEPEMFRARLDFFLRSINRLRDSPPPVISVGGLLAGQEPQNYAGAIPDERAPAALRQSIVALMERIEGPAALGMPSRDEFVTIIRQAFGMLAGIDVNPSDDQVVPYDASTVAIDLLANGQPTWTLELRANADTALTLTADMMGAVRAAVDPDHALRGLGEIARVVARRVRQIALENEIRLDVGDPRECAPSNGLASRSIVFGGRDIAPFSAAIGIHEPAANRKAACASPVYLLLLRGDRNIISPERKSILDAYRAWISKLAEHGAILAGSDLNPEPCQIVRLVDQKVTNIPSPIEASRPILGCWMIEAPGDAQAVDWARKLPFGDGSVEVRRIGPLADAVDRVS